MSGVQFDLDLDADDALDQVFKLGGGLDELIEDFRRLDKLSGKAFGDSGGKLRDANGRFLKMRDNVDGVSDSFKGMNGSLAGGVAKGALLAGVITGVATAAKDAVFALARMAVQGVAAFGGMVIQASSFRERMAFGFKTLSKGASNGTAELAKMRKLSMEFGTDFEETSKSVMRLQKMGFGAAEAEELFKTMQDLRTVGAGDDELQRALLAITQIKGTGKIQGDELNQLADAGVDLDAVYAALAKNLGKTVPEIIKMKEAGQIDAATGIRAIKEAIAETTGAKFAGQKGKEFADSTITGMANRIKAMGGVLSDMFAEHLGPTFAKLKPILDDVMTALQSDEAKAVMVGIADAVGAIFKGAVAAWPVVKEFLAGFWSEGKKIWEVVKQIGGQLSEAFGGDSKLSMEDIMAAARVLGRVLAWVVVLIGIFVVVLGTVIGIAAGVVGAILAIPAALLGLVASLGVLISEFGGKALAIGTAIVDGIKNGITNGAAKVIGAVKGLAQSAINAATTTLTVRSPSKEFEWIGNMVGAGFEGGIKDSTPSATGAMQDMVNPASAAPAQSGGGRTPIVINMTFGPGTSKADAQHIRDEMERAMQSVLERHALEAGL